MQMGRVRTRRKDLPPGLHFDDRFGVYFYRGTRGGARLYRPLGKVTREAAIRAWVEITKPRQVEAPAGTVGELLDRYERDEMGELAAATKTNYKWHLGKLRERWGKREYAVTADEAVRRGALRVMDVSACLREAKAAGKGYFSVAYGIGVLQGVFAKAREWGLTEYNPCVGAKRKQPEKKTRLPELEAIEAVAARARPRMRLMIELARRTGMRQTDIRNLQVQQIGAVLAVVQAKTGMEQDWDITPALEAIFAEAEKLPGRACSMFVFPQRNGKPLSEQGFQSEWRTLKTGFQFRSIRKWAINQVIAAGGNATDFAGHFDARTTRRHYDLTVKKVRPL
jgi:integrase